MRCQFLVGAMLAAFMAVGTAGYAQQPREKGPPEAGGDRGDKAPPRGGPRTEDNRPPPPGKAGPRPKGDHPAEGQPEFGPPRGPREGGARGFSGERGGGFGGFPPGAMPGGMRGGSGGGYGGFGAGGMMPGGYGRPMPGMPGEPPPEDREMAELMMQDAELEGRTMEMAERARIAPGDERAKLRTQLAEVVNKHFDVRQKRRELQLKRMEEELKRLQEAISDRNKSRESIVSKRMLELVGDPKDLDF